VEVEEYEQQRGGSTVRNHLEKKKKLKKKMVFQVARGFLSSRKGQSVSRGGERGSAGEGEGLKKETKKSYLLLETCAKSYSTLGGS